jgi:hypothetical protein
MGDDDRAALLQVSEHSSIESTQKEVVDLLEATGVRPSLDMSQEGELTVLGNSLQIPIILLAAFCVLVDSTPI